MVALMEETVLYQKCVHVLQDGLVTIAPKVRRDASMNDHFQDINECNGDHECDQGCNNTVGSYSCSCDDGYLLGTDGRTCEGKPTHSVHIFLELGNIIKLRYNTVMIIALPKIFIRYI